MAKDLCQKRNYPGAIVTIYGCHFRLQVNLKTDLLQRNQNIRTRIATYLYSQPTKLLLISRNINYPRKNLTYLKQVYTFQSNQIKFENLKSSLPLKRFIVRFLTTLNPRKSQIKASLSYLANSCFYNYKPSPRKLRQHCVLRNLRKNKDIVITKLDKGN